MDSDEDKTAMYQFQLLDAFGLKEYNSINSNKINVEVMSIYNKIKDCPQFKDFKNDEVIMLICFFSFDTFDLFHKCLVDFNIHDYILEDATKNMVNAFSRGA